MINKAQFEKYVTDPGLLNLATIPELEKLLEAFPYCQSTQLLYVKNLHKEHNIHFNQQLRIAAAYAGDRGLLRQLLEEKREQEAYEPTTVDEEPDKKEPAINETENKPDMTYSSVSEEQDAGTDKDTKEAPKAISFSDIGSEIKGREKASDPVQEEKEKKSKGFQEAEQDEKEETKEESFLEVGYPYNEEETSEEEIKTAKTPSERRRKELERLREQLHELRMEREKIEEVIREERSRKAKNYASQKSKLTKEKPEKAESSEEKEPQKTPAVKNETSTISSGDKKKDKITEENIQGSDTSGQLKSPRKSKKELIDKFIREEPSIKRGVSSFYDPTEAARKSIMESDDIATETLARLYLKQGKVLQAIKIYEKLSLKFPEKSDYFAGQIGEIKKTNK